MCTCVVCGASRTFAALGAHSTFSLTHDPFSLTGPTLQPLHVARPDFAGSTIQCEEGLADTSKATATALELLMLTKTESTVRHSQAG